MNKNFRKVLLAVLRIITVLFFVSAFGFPNAENVLVGVVGFMSCVLVGFVFFILTEKLETAELARNRRNYVPQKIAWKKRYH